MKTHKLSKLAYLSIVIILGASTNAMAQEHYRRWPGMQAWVEDGHPAYDPRNYPYDPSAVAAIEPIDSEMYRAYQEKVKKFEEDVRANQTETMRQRRVDNLGSDFKTNLLKADNLLEGYKYFARHLSYDQLLAIMRNGEKVEFQGITNIAQARAAVNSQLTYLQHELRYMINGTVEVAKMDQTLKTIRQFLDRENTISGKIRRFLIKPEGRRAFAVVFGGVVGIMAGASHAASVDSLNLAPLNSDTKPKNFSNKSWASQDSGDVKSAR